MTSDSKDSKNHGNRKPKRKVPGSEISQLIPEKTSRTAVGRPAKNLVAKGGESGSVTVDPPTVVGVGASAGGLDAFQKLLRHLPADTGMAFVLIQHLDPHHISHLPDLLAKTTSMPVVEVREDIAIEADHVYTIAPDTTLGIYHGMLRVYERVTKRGKHLPVDFFLHSLAEECGDRSIGVVLSGTASDGTEGLGAIKAAGGFTFAESERSAEYFGMPGSAISAGCVDFVLPPNQIANQLARIARTPIPKSGGSADAHKQYPKGDLSKIFLLLRLHTGNDFSEYKKSTILRRISRRMTVLKMDQLSDYIRYLQNTHEEIDAFFKKC